MVGTGGWGLEEIGWWEGRRSASQIRYWRGHLDAMLDSRELGSVLLIALLRSVTRQIRRDWFPNREILECFEHLSTDGGCRAVVLSGAGKNFTAGRREGRGGGGGGGLYSIQSTKPSTGSQG